MIDQVVDFTSERFKTNNIELKFSNITDEIMFECKPSQISQVILNLLHNAFDAVQGKENAWVEIGSTIEDDKLVLLITDSGNGIPPEVAAKIMQPLFSTKDPDNMPRIKCLSWCYQGSWWSFRICAGIKKHTI